MSSLHIFNEHHPATLMAQYGSSRIADIARELGSIGVRFEQWCTQHQLAADANQNNVVSAYRADIERLMEEQGYQSVDVVSMHPQHPDRTTLRQKFLREHTHSEDEVRFFVAGAGLFALHVQDKVYNVLCEAGDLISVPGGMRHWFDMGTEPYFVAIRLFTNADGWIAHFTGSQIAQHFPQMPPQVIKKHRLIDGCDV